MLHRSKWSSEFAFFVAATGSAVGLGNIWKFPYIVSEYGGGVFILAYLLCILIIGIPIMLAEVNLGFIGNANTVQTIQKLAHKRHASKFWPIIGYSGMLAAFLILSFYMVICGWVADYLFGINALLANPDPQVIAEEFGGMSQDFNRQLFWFSAMVLLTTTIMSGSIRGTVEKVFELIMPLLGILLIFLAGYSVYEGSATEALRFMFSFDFSQLNAEMLVVAMGQAFFTLSLGMGAIMVFGSYLPAGSSVVKVSCTVALADTLVALVAAVIVFSLVFELGLDMSQGGGPGLVFKVLPYVFHEIPGGRFAAVVFFFALLLAAISSAMSLHEPLICYLTEKYNFSRRQVSVGIGLMVWVLGIPVIFSFTDNFGILGTTTWFAMVDFFSSSILLPLGGFLIAIFTGWIVGQEVFRQNIKMPRPLYFLLFWSLRGVAPLSILAIFLHVLGVF